MMQLMHWLGRRCTLQAALTSSPTGRQRWGSLLASFHVSGPSVVPVLLFYLHQASNCVQVPCWTFGTLTVKGCMWWGTLLQLNGQHEFTAALLRVMSADVQGQRAQSNEQASSSQQLALQVLDDNIWEQRAQSHQQASSSRPDLPADMETDAVLPAPRSQQPQRTLEAAHSQQLLSAPAEFVSGRIMEAPSDRRAVAPAEQPSKRARFSAPTQRSPRWDRAVCVSWSSSSGRSAAANKRLSAAAAWRDVVCVVSLSQPTVLPQPTGGSRRGGRQETPLLRAF